jgi:hypothetical protein
MRVPDDEDERKLRRDDVAKQIVAARKTRDELQDRIASRGTRADQSTQSRDPQADTILDRLVPMAGQY